MASQLLSDGPTVRLLRLVHTLRWRATRTTLLSLAVSCLVLGLGLALTLAPIKRSVGLFFFAATGTSVAVLVALALRRPREDLHAAARLVGERAPALREEVRSALELLTALPHRTDFSLALAQAYVEGVDRRAATVPPAGLIDRRPQRLSGAVALALVLAAGYLVAVFPERLTAGLSALAKRQLPTLIARRPITGDVTLTYRYPAYMSLEPKTVEGTNGELSGPPGTEVKVVTRADRDVSAAALEVNGQRLPLTVDGRTLSGQLVLDQPGQYHVLFLEGDDVEARGPDLPIRIEPDVAPTVQLSSPEAELELDPDRRDLPVTFSISDDYGLTKVALVVRPEGKPEQRLPVKVDDGRTARGTYTWNVAALQLAPGASVSYFLEATDNDTIKGPKVGVSRTQVVRLYSAAAHHRAALERAEALWERLVTHLADRIEAPERKAPVTEATASPQADQRARGLSQDMTTFAQEQLAARDPLPDLPEAMRVVSKRLREDTLGIAIRRRPGGRLMQLIEADVKHSEANVMYLEQLLDRRKLDALEQLTKELREDRRTLSSLIDQFRGTKDEATQKALLDHMRQIKERMQALREQMAALSKGIRDEFINQESLQEKMQENDLDGALEDIERLVREGNADEAARKMQELAMQMDRLLDDLQDASERADEEADPELSRIVKEFEQTLEGAIGEQEKLLEQTKALQAKARAAAADRLKKQGASAKKEALAELEALEKSLKQPQSGFDFDDRRARALNEARSTKLALEADDFDAAQEAANRLAEATQEVQREAQHWLQRDEMLGTPPSLKRESQQRVERAKRDTARAENVAQALERLFPKPGEGLDEGEKKSLGELGQQQRALGERVESLKSQMQSINERAPVFDDEAQGRAEAAGQQAREGHARLDRQEPGRAAGAQQGVLEALNGLKEGLQRPQTGGGSGRGLPRPFAQRARGNRDGNGRDDSHPPMTLPDEDPNQAARALRQDVMEAMKQGAPDRYRAQNKHYYEELVK